MTEVQVYDGEGITARILESEITDLIMKAYPTELPERTKEWLRRQVNSHLDDILNDRQQGILEEEYEKNEESNRETLPEDWGAIIPGKGLSVSDLDGVDVDSESNILVKPSPLKPEKTAIDWDRLTREQLAELEAAIGPVNRNIEESDDSSPSV